MIFPKYFFKSLLFCFFSVCFFSFSVCAEEKAVDITHATKMSFDSGVSLAALTDEARTTEMRVTSGDILYISAETPIGAVVIEFAETPSPYTAVSASEKIECGTHGFLHETIVLSNAAQHIALSLPDVKICEIQVFSEGALPADVQNWQPAQGTCDLLVFPTHADDDTLYFGPLIATAVNDRRSVQIAYLIHHWDTQPRPHELLDGLWAMGVRRYPVIGTFEDIPSRSLTHAASVYDTKAMLAYQVEQIRKFKPAVVAGHDLDGEYGHGVHMLNSHLLKKAVAQSGDAAFFPESADIWGVWRPLKTYFHLYKEAMLTLNVHRPLDYFSQQTAMQVAENGFKKHVSQHQWDIAVEDFGEGDCRLFGLYDTQVGADSGANDIFEHVTASTPDSPVSVSSEAAVSSEQCAVSPAIRQNKASALWSIGATFFAVLFLVIFLMLQTRKK